MHFDVAIFTNLTRDHLDYHGDEANYEAAKTILFDWPGLKHAVVNLDDPMGHRLVAHIKASRAARKPAIIGYTLKDIKAQPNVPGISMLRASAVRDAEGLLRFDVDVNELKAQDLTIGRAQFHLRRGDDGNSIDMVAQADQAKGALGVFGKETGSLRLFQTLERARAYMLLLKGQTTASESHGAWHDEGGIANVTRTELNGQENAMTPEQAGTITALLVCTVIAVLFVGADAAVLPMLPTVTDEILQSGYQEFFQTCIQALIWIPYMARSRRVHATFVNEPE